MRCCSWGPGPARNCAVAYSRENAASTPAAAVVWPRNVLRVVNALAIICSSFVCLSSVGRSRRFNPGRLPRARGSGRARSARRNHATGLCLSRATSGLRPDRQRRHLQMPAYHPPGRPASGGREPAVDFHEELLATCRHRILFRVCRALRLVRSFRDFSATVCSTSLRCSLESPRMFWPATWTMAK